MTISNDEMVGKLKFMAMDTLHTGVDRAFFLEVADRFNWVQLRLLISQDDNKSLQLYADAVTEAAADFNLTQ